jgi:hypothetical protein
MTDGCMYAQFPGRARHPSIAIALLLALPLLCQSHEAQAWGADGHGIVAEIAQRDLDKAVKERVDGLLQGRSLAAVSMRADTLVSQQPETSRWHFVNIPLEAESYDPARDCRPSSEGDCVIEAILRATSVLGEARTPERDRAEALMLLIHLVADIHVSLHAAERNGDHGGFDVILRFRDQAIPLHLFWDYGALEAWGPDWGTHADLIVERHRDVPASVGCGRDAMIKWAMESHRDAAEVAYQYPADGVVDDAYLARTLAVIERRLWLAGKRLAYLLNSILRADSLGCVETN